MKMVFLFLFAPCVLAAQTIHFEDDEILYKGKIKAVQANATTATGLQEALMKADGEVLKIDTDNNKVMANGVMELLSPFRIIRKLHFTIQLTPAGNDMAYRINNVSVIEKRRGGRVDTTDAKDLLEGREQTGPPAIANEKLLNEIDMRIQELLARLKRRYK